MRKRKSEAVDEAPEPTTPTTTPARKKLKLSEGQKQALIDNLQLEITERARKLRAHYALQCADLRARVERRVNRIPMAMRKMTMGELMAKNSTAARPQAAQNARTQANYAAARDRPLPPLPQDRSPQRASPIRAQQSPSKGKKRKSSQIHIASDKENDVFVPDSLPIAKKTRTKANTGATARAVSRAGKANVLSPRSHNSRTLPQSPVKSYGGMSPMKSTFARPISPIKPVSPLKSAASAATSAISASMHGMIESTKRGTAAAAGKLSRTASREKTSPAKSTTATATNTRGKMLPPPRPVAPSSPQRTASQSSTHTSASDSSAVSTGTTVVKPKRGTRTAAATKAAPATKTRTTRTAGGTAATKPTAASVAKEKAAGVGAKGGRAAANKAVLVEPAAGKRVLRKRA
jgi:hypothetical protein